jgi:hypothetical protein
MPQHIRFLKTIPLLPDSELLQEFEAAQRRARETQPRAGDRSSRRQIDRRLEALKTELKNRGIDGPPWWAPSS